MNNYSRKNLTQRHNGSYETVIPMRFVKRLEKKRVEMRWTTAGTPILIVTEEGAKPTMHDLERVLNRAQLLQETPYMEAQK